MSNAESPRVMMTSITTFKATKQVDTLGKAAPKWWAIFTIDNCLHAYSFSISIMCVYQYQGEFTELKLDISMISKVVLIVQLAKPMYLNEH